MCRNLSHWQWNWNSVQFEIFWTFFWFKATFSDSFRWLGAPLDGLAGLDARAPNVRGRGTDALYPRGSEFRPADGHGDRSLRLAHGQRQPAHLAIDTTRHWSKCNLASNFHNVTENSGGFLAPKVVQNNITERICYRCVMDNLTLLTSWGRRW